MSCFDKIKSFCQFLIFIIVTIDKPENIILYDSEVGLWGTDNVKVLKGLKKNDRKNKHKL